MKINGNTAKAGRAVQVGDALEISTRGRVTRLKVLELPQKSFSKARARECYELVGDSSDD